MFTPRPRSLTRPQSYKLVEIYIEDILDGKPVDLTKLSFVQDFDITIDSNNVFDVISKLLYYRLYRHSQYIQENEIAHLLQILYKKQKFKSNQLLFDLLKKCFSSAINNYITTHGMSVSVPVSTPVDAPADTRVDTPNIPKRKPALIVAYSHKLIQQYQSVFDAQPTITLISDYEKLRKLDAMDHAMYTIMSKHGFNDAACKIFEQSFAIANGGDGGVDAVDGGGDTANATNTAIATNSPNYIDAKSKLSAMSNESCAKLITLYNPDKYTTPTHIVEKIKKLMVAPPHANSE
jgi:hypothetical protein